MVHLAKMMKEKYGIPFRHVSYFGIEDTSRALYDVAEFFKDRAPEMMGRTRDLVREELKQVLPHLQQYKSELAGKRAAVYVGGAFKAFSLVRALRTIGMDTVVVGSQTGSRDDYEQLRQISDPGTILVDDTNPVELAAFMKEKQVDLFIGGVKERPLAYKLGVAFCDHNHERKQPLAGFEGMLHFAAEVHASVTSPVWQFARRRVARQSALESKSAVATKSAPETELTPEGQPALETEPALEVQPALTVLLNGACEAGASACTGGSTCSHCH
jgi:nitrogenase molybdenum-cofactor synthesis protein NifE